MSLPKEIKSVNLRDKEVLRTDTRFVTFIYNSIGLGRWTMSQVLRSEIRKTKKGLITRLTNL